MKQLVCFAYGVVAYVAFLVTILYAIGFVGEFVVPKSINTGTVVGLGEAILVNVLLLGAFAVQHTIMARPGFKRWWTRIVPEPVERSTFVLLSSLLLLLLFWQWRPLPQSIWHTDQVVVRYVLTGLSLLGWVTVFYASFLIDHFDLFGLRQVYLYLVGKEYSQSPFATPWLYGVVRNPLMLGFVMAFWFAPTMSQGRLLFAVVATAYILVGIRLEERDISAALGEEYRRYRERTPMLIPWPRFSPSTASAGKTV